MMALSDLTVRQAKAADKRLQPPRHRWPRPGGLCRTGGKSWHLRYYWLGKQKRISLGNYPEIGLREARLARRSPGSAGQGHQPQTERDQKRHAVKLAAEYTFKAVFDAWVEHRRKELKEGRQSTLSQILRIFNKDVLPTLGKMSIYDIRRPQLVGVLAAIEERKAFTTAEKVRTWLNQLFRYALVIVEGLEANPASDLDVVAEPKPPVNHNPYLHLPELPEFLQKLRLYNPRGWQTQLGIRLLFLTGVRTGELRLADPGAVRPRPRPVDHPAADRQATPGRDAQGRQAPAGRAALHRAAVPAGHRDRALPLGRDAAGAEVHLLSHRSELKKRISENTLNKALKRMGYEDATDRPRHPRNHLDGAQRDRLPKIWVDAQLSHSDPNKVSSAYNHAKYVEPRRRMMQDWADRLDLLEQGQVEAASAHLTIRIDGVPAMAEVEEVVGAVPCCRARCPRRAAVVATPIVVTPNSGGITFQRLSQVPPPPTHAPEPEVSAIQREREEMLAIYESPNNLPVPLFGKLAGKSKDQINRELKAGKLLSISLGNRGQRVPDWQLVPLKHKLAQVLMNQCPHADSWDLYRMLTQPHPDLGDRAAIDAVTPTNVHASSGSSCGDYQHHADAPEAVAAAAHPRGCAAERSSAGGQRSGA
jgi:integrase